MAKRKKTASKRRMKRPSRRKTFVLLRKSEKQQIREFSKFIPSLDEYRGKDKITSAQYSAFKRAKNHLRHTDNLRPVTEAQAKKLKGKLAGHGIRAIRLRNVVKGDEHSRVVSVTTKGTVITSNGRRWEYHQVSGVNSGSSDEVAEDLIEAGIALFHRTKNPPFQLHLWTSKGRSNEGASSPEKWVALVASFVLKYQNANAFLFGIAAMITNGGKTRKPLPKSAFKNINREIEEDEEEEE